MVAYPLPAPDELPATLDPAAAEETAEMAGLRYISDTTPGIRRERAGDDWRYIAPNGKPILNPRAIERIKHIGIPPAWTDVWICPQANGHIQATARATPLNPPM
jgi:DNA topoisomerase-1